MTELEFIYFREVARTLNFSKAAERLFITQPTLSRCIAKLESEFGTPLFIRDKRNVNLTTAGIALFNNYHLIQEAKKQVHDTVLSAAEGRRAKLTIGIQEGQLISRKLKNVLFQFEEEHPDITLAVVSHLYNDLFDQLNSNTIDVALSLDFENNIYPDISCKEIEMQRSNAVVSSDHPAAGCPDSKASLEMLNGLDLMMVNPSIVPNVTDTIFNACVSNGFTPANIRYAPSYPTLFSWITMEYGFVIMNQNYWYNNSDVKFIPLSENTGMQFCAYWNNIGGSAAALLLVEHIAETFNR